MTDTKIREFSIDSEIQNQLNSKYQWFVSSRGASLNTGMHVTQKALQGQEKHTIIIKEDGDLVINKQTKLSVTYTLYIRIKLAHSLCTPQVTF